MLKLKVATIGMVLGTLFLGTNAPARTNVKTSALEKWSFAGESYGVRIFFKINR